MDCGVVLVLHWRLVLESPDRSRATVISMTPANAVESVGVLENIELVFSKPLAESSFEDGIIDLRIQFDVSPFEGAVVGTTSWDRSVVSAQLFGDPGPDGEFLTADDVVTTQTDFDSSR